MTDAERIREIKAREEAAFGGEWKHSDSRLVSSCKSNGCVQRHICNIFGFGTSAGITEAQYGADADFIANARQDIPWLLDQLEAAMREKAERENPKPCDGCGFQRMPERGACWGCTRNRMIRADNYTPKGAER